jgi:hypothetical protein
MLDDFYDDSENINYGAPAQNYGEKMWGTGVRKIVPPTLPGFQGQTLKKKELNYDDILAGMNLCIKNGKLHSLDKSAAAGVGSEEPDYRGQFEQYKQQFGIGGGGIGDSGFENSVVPDKNIMSPEQYKIIMMRRQQLYKRAVWVENLKREAQRRRIQMVKSKKMLFSSGNVFHQNMNVYNGNNKLFGLMGK